MRALTRRHFLANAAALGAALTVARSSWADSSDQRMETNHPSGSELQTRKDKMKTRKLGRLEVSEMGAGCMSISANYGPPAPRS